MWVQLFNVLERKIDLFCSTLVEVGCNDSAKDSILLIMSEAETFWSSSVGEIRSPSSCKHCLNNNSAALPSKSF